MILKMEGMLLPPFFVGAKHFSPIPQFRTPHTPPKSNFQNHRITGPRRGRPYGCSLVLDVAWIYECPPFEWFVFIRGCGSLE